MFRFFRENAIDQIYAYEMLQKFALSLIGIFIPIYIATEGFPLESVFLFILVDSAAFMLASIPVSYFIARIGFKHSLVISYAFYIPAFLSLRFLGVSNSLIISAGILLGVGKALHWVSLNSEFAVDSDEDDRGKASGRILGLPGISKALAPFLGGVIMAFYGFEILVSAALVFVFFSAVPLLASRDHRDPLGYSLRSLVDRRHGVFASLFVLRGVSIATGKYLFPLYVFYFIGGTLNAGGVQSLAALGSVAFALLVGRITDRVEKKHMLMVGAVASGVIFALRAFVTVPLEAFLVSFIGGLFFMLYFVPLFSRLADYAEDEDVLEFYAFREVFLSIGRIGILLIALSVSLTYSVETGFRVAFYVTAVTTTLLALYSRWIK